MLVADAVDIIAQSADVLVIADKRSRDNVCAVLQTELNIAPVLSAYVRHTDVVAGDVYTLAVGQSAALVDLAGDFFGINLCYGQRNHTVVKQNLSAFNGDVSGLVAHINQSGI